MENTDISSEPVKRTQFGKKRKCNTANYSRNRCKIQRLGGGNHIPRLVCNHNDRLCQATKLTSEDAYSLNYKFHDMNSKKDQDAFLLTYMSVREPKKPKPQNQKRKVSVKYSVLNLKNEKIPVCKATFMAIFGMIYCTNYFKNLKTINTCKFCFFYFKG